MTTNIKSIHELQASTLNSMPSSSFIISDSPDLTEARKISLSEFAKRTNEKSVNQTNHGFIVGDAITFNGTQYVKANSSTLSMAHILGIVHVVHDTNNFEMTTSGFLGGLSGKVAGQVYYLTKTGTLSTHPDNDIISAAYLAISSSEVFVIDSFPSIVKVPDRFTVTENNISVAQQNAINLTKTIPLQRFAGILVKVEGLTANQKLKVQLSGDSTHTEAQYLAEFTDTKTHDNAGAWIYRNLLNNRSLYIKLTNELTQSVNVNLTIIGEPF